MIRITVSKFEDIDFMHYKHTVIITNITGKINRTGDKNTIYRGL